MFFLIKNIFGDILVLYKNFLHFNLSKIVIYLVSILYTIIFVLPFAIVLGGLYYYLMTLGNIDVFSSNIYMILFVGLLFVSGFITAIIAFSYNYILLTNLNLSYIDGKKLKLGNNHYLNFKLFFVYFRTMLLNFVIIFTPFVIGMLFIVILVIFAGGVEGAKNLSISGALNYFTITSFIITIITIITFIYLMYKTLFTVIILASESEGKKFKTPLYYIKKSFKLTSGFKTAFRFIIVSILVFLITIPVSIPLNYTTYSNERLSDYIFSVTNPDDKINSDFYYIEDLKAEFGSKDTESLIIELDRSTRYRIMLEILNFLLIFGLFEMMLLSFYKRELLSKTKTKKNSSKKNGKNSS